MLSRLIMWLCHLNYKRCKYPIYYVKGKGKHYPRYMIYTEDESVYRRMDNF